MVHAQTSVTAVKITHVEATALDNGEVRVLALVSVLDAENQPVPGLKARDFVLQENSTPIESQNLTIAPATFPITFTLLLDTSRNMQNQGPTGVRALDSAKEAAIALIDRLAPDDHIAIYTYHAQVQLLQDVTYDHNLAIDRGLVPLEAGQVQTTCLYDALARVMENVTNQGQGRHAILVLTRNPDSTTTDTCSGVTVDDVIETATIVGKALPIYTVGFGNNINQAELERLSQWTGGVSLTAPDSTSLSDLLVKVAAQLKGQYQISYVTQSNSGLATIKITEQSSQRADDRQVFIPVAIPPTATPLPQFAIGLAVEQIGAGQLAVKVKVPADVTLEQTELFVDNKTIQKAVSPPFDQFNLDMLELGSGKHKIRVEVTDANKILAKAEIEVEVQISSTPVPTASPTAAPRPTPTPEPGFTSTMPALSLLLIIAGLVILLGLVGLIAYLLFFYAKQQPTVTLPPPPAPPPLNPMITIDEEPALVPRRLAELKEVTTRQAKLVVLAGHEVLTQPEFSLYKAEIKIGRNTAKETFNDIPVQDKEVSRSHAKIVCRDQNFYIQDLNSATGTLVNRLKINSTQEMLLYHGAEIMIGPTVKFRFEFVQPPAIDQTLADFTSQDGLRTQDDNEDPNQTFYAKK
jgi:VWFA-related protein